MNKKAVIVLMIISLGFNAGVLVTMGHHWLRHRAFERHPATEIERHQKRMQKMLQLTEPQAQKMHADWEAMQKMIEPVKLKLEEKRAALFSLIDSGTADVAAIDRIIGEIAPLQIQLEKTIFEHSLAFSKTLTADQRLRFKAVFQKNAKRMPHGPGFMPPKMDY
ncbi:MAG: periplasmic heavy metal sensor [Elusimicrobia bacterium]|nr:periplasmic heavy metal sensor [Elusimicrobiota bacterium]